MKETMGQVIRLYEDNPNEKGLREAAEMLRHDAVAIFPTDSFYAFGCSLESHKAINRIKLLKRKSVAVVPGDAFGECGSGYIRCSYATSMEGIREALKRIGDFVKEIKAEQK